jgi:DNA polymerase III subunit epsilon
MSRLLLLCFDTETTGLPLWKEPSEHPDQPHIVELAAVLVDSETREEVERLSVVIRPDGWEIPAETTAIHGITNEYAAAEGIDEKEAVERFLTLHARADVRIGFNESFDARILRIGMKRFLGDAIADEFKQKPKVCAMWESKPLCAIPQPGKRSGHKLPTLGEAFLHLTGEAYHDAHRALSDVQATLAVYWALCDRLGAPPEPRAPAPVVEVTEDAIAGALIAANAALSAPLPSPPHVAAPEPTTVGADPFAVS